MLGRVSSARGVLLPRRWRSGQAMRDLPQRITVNILWDSGGGEERLQRREMQLIFFFFSFLFLFISNLFLVENWLRKKKKKKKLNTGECFSSFQEFSWSKDRKILGKQKGKKMKERGGGGIKRVGKVGGRRKTHETWNSANLTYNKQNYTLLSFKLWLPSIKVSFRCINWIRHYFPIIICKVQPSILHEIPAAYRRSIYFSGLIYFHDSPIMTAMQAVHQN